VGGVRWDGTTSLLDPSSGQRASLTATPFWSMLDGSTFTRLLATGSTYLDVTGDARGVLALRASVGSVVGTSFDNITLDKRFYAGGGGSVRGYGYREIGPRSETGDPSGGRSLVELSAEARIRTGLMDGAISVVPFVDAGSVGEDQIPDFGSIRFGAGVGVRYHTGFGPLRLDVAVPLNPGPNDNWVAVYVALGQAF
jgi:translocation and assembly module TamA